MAQILYFSKDYTPHDHRFLSALAETEHEVFYLKLEHSARQTEDRPLPSEVEQVLWEGGQHEFHWRDLPRLLLGLKGVIRGLKPDLIHAGPIQDVGLLTALSGFHPALIMSWGFDLMQDADRNWLYRRLTFYVLRFADAFASDCEATREKAIAFGVPRERTVVFPWGVDLRHFSPRPSAASRQQRGRDFVLLCNRSWEPRYGIDVLARAFVKVAQQRPDVALMLLAGGSQANLVRQILTAGGVMERVHFGGQISQTVLPRYYHMADLYVSASHIDGSSVSLMEALACGLPVVVSDIPANREWVSEGVNGWLFPDGDADALAAVILRLMAGRKRLAAVAKAARATAEERSDWKKNFGKLLQAYELALYSSDKRRSR